MTPEMKDSSMILRLKATGARSLIVGAITGLCGVLLIVSPLGTAFEEEVGLAWLFRVRGPIAAPSQVAVVAINSTTGSQLGLPKLPRDWPRTVHAALIKSLTERQAAVSVLDIDFSRVKSGYEDSMLALAIAAADRIVLFERLAGRRQPLEGAGGKVDGWTWVEEKISPSPLLAHAATALAPFALPKLGQAAIQFWTFKPSLGDLPTTVSVALQLYALPVYGRWRQLLEAAGAQGLDQLPASAAAIRKPPEVRRVMGVLRQMFLADPGLAERMRAQLDREANSGGDAAVPLMRALVALYAGARDRYLNFYGPPGTITTVPYSKLVHQRPNEGFVPVGLTPAADGSPDLRGRVVFVGYSDLFEPDQPDRFYTVFTGSDGVDLSGVEIMATAFGNLLTDRTLRPANAAISAGLLLVFGLLVGGLASSLPALWSIPLTLAAATFCGWFNQMAFDSRDLWLPVATPFLVQLPLALLLGLMSQYLVGRYRQQRMSRAMSYYLPAHVVRDLTEGRVEPDAVDKVVFGTCLATDMSGFSTIAETKSPDELATFMNAYFDALASALKEHHVDVTEFHADTIMCAWLAGEPEIAKRRLAVLAAIDAVEAIEAFSRTQQGIVLNPRIGLQDGHFYLGHTGGGGRLAYSILGDPANTAARLESLNKHLGSHILGAASVVRGLDEVLTRPLGRFQLKGRAEATPIAEILALGAHATPQQFQLCARFAEALSAFEAHQWQRAHDLFDGILADCPDDGPARFFAARCQQIIAGSEPEEDLDVIKMDMK
jgi:adenylate cyclase